MDISWGRVIVWIKTSYKDASVVIDPEDDRQGDGQRTSLTGPVYKSTRASGSRSTGTDGIYAHRQPSRRTALVLVFVRVLCRNFSFYLVLVSWITIILVLVLWKRRPIILVLVLIFVMKITLLHCALSCSAVYCNHPCLFVCLFVGLLSR